ncbi:hypothetical protein COO60DRAFT_1486371, partial [Scenedesmus sp. NREL 46B-D3]
VAWARSCGWPRGYCRVFGAAHPCSGLLLLVLVVVLIHAQPAQPLQQQHRCSRQMTAGPLCWQMTSCAHRCLLCCYQRQCCCCCLC